MKDDVSLRDYFAAHCPVSLSEFIELTDNRKALKETLELYSAFRYMYSDTMIKIGEAK